MNWKNILFHRKTLWVALGLLAMALRATMSPDFIERFYSRGLFQAVRFSFDAINRWMPFAMVYLLFFGLLFWLGWRIRGLVKNTSEWRIKLMNTFTGLLAFAGGAVFFFLFLWGFNYGRIPLETTLSIEPKPLTVSELREELDAETAAVLRLRAAVPGASDSAIARSFLPADLENTMRTQLTRVLQQSGYPTPGKMRGRLLLPKGILLRISTAGVYIPFTGEGHIDAGLHHLQLPFVVAHEMSHGYGFGDEGTCNFLAYLACTQSSDPFLQYVGSLYYWRYVAADYRDFAPEEYEAFRETLPQGLKSDLLAIRNEMAKYPDILPSFRDAAYTVYLQAQGISEGLKNYDRVIMLVHAWRKR
jgi:hypothetical protein